MLSKKEQFIKRWFDIVVALPSLFLSLIPIFFLILFASISSRQFGLFFQERLGKYGVPFTIYKIRSLPTTNGKFSMWFSRNIRSSKLDELPQLLNVLIGDMSLVGPRPDIRGYADRLEGVDRIILQVRPGITGPATIKYKNEEQLLEQVSDPQNYNDTVIWPDKVKINRQYVENWSFIKDLRYLLQTFFN